MPACSMKMIIHYLHLYLFEENFIWKKLRCGKFWIK